MTEGLRPWLVRWFHSVVASGRAFAADDGILMSAALAYYAFMSIFPLCLLSISVFGFLWTEPVAVQYTMRFAADLLPPHGLPVVQDTISDIAADRGRLGLLGLVTLLWLGRFLFDGLEMSVSRIFEVQSRRSMVRRTLVSFGLILLGGVLILAEVLLSAFLSWVQTVTAQLQLPWSPAIDSVAFWQVVHSWIITPATVFAITFLLYVRLPRVRQSKRRCVPGATFCMIVWKLASLLYFNYLFSLSRANPVYGSIWSVVGLLIWFYLCAAVFLLGAELIRHQGGLGS